MARTWKLGYYQQAIAQLPREGLPWEVLSGEIVRHVRQVVGFDGWCLSLTDPDTGLPTAAVGTYGSPVSSCQRRFWQLEYLVPDVSSKASMLVASSSPVAVLSRETGGDLPRSRRWAELLSPAGAADELRAILRADGVPWGALAVYRAGRPGAATRFSADDIQAVEALLGTLSMVARASWAATPPGPADSGDGPATLIAAVDGRLIDATPTAQIRLSRLGRFRQAGHTLMYALLARLAAEMKYQADHRSGDHASVSVLTPAAAGGWTEVHAALLAGSNGRGGNGRRAAVTIQPATVSRVRPVLLRAYALSERERQVAALAADGMPAKDIAAVLYISPHTARDHLKTIFRKTRSHTRQELAARLGGSASY